MTRGAARHGQQRKKSGKGKSRTPLGYGPYGRASLRPTPSTGAAKAALRLWLESLRGAQTLSAQEFCLRQNSYVLCQEACNKDSHPANL
jgi:hypothetical protein